MLRHSIIVSVLTRDFWGLVPVTISGFLEHIMLDLMELIVTVRYD